MTSLGSAPVDNALTSTRSLPADAFTAHQAGWEHCLDHLATCAAGGDPGPDPLRVG
jgi:hypothetical protein